MRALIVYVHGLWLNGWEASWLRRRLQRELGCTTRLFHYPSVSGQPGLNAAALGQYLSGLEADAVHLVGHSLGGCLILELFEREMSPRGRLGGRPLPPGRIVLLGSPIGGSRAAARLARLPYGARLMGKASELLLNPPPRRWSGARALGVIAGNRPLGLGRLLGPMAAPSDGTVLVEETRLAGAADHLVLRVSHSGLVFSSQVARHTAAFLRDGRFASAP